MSSSSSCIFTHTTLSASAKQDAGAYRMALERMGASAEDVLFIDDNEAPARGAESCGIHAVLHRDNATTIAAIERFLAS
ncbi:HAD-IA family hydrolase [Microbacterium aerolatum]|nr:HAD-IA family hydrolase [Microbacterium aerolatum]